MTNYTDVCDRWVEKAVHGRDLRDKTTQRVYYEGDTIFSYGSHFPMARVVRDDAGEFSFVLVNGNTYSPSTSNHQRHMRDAISGLRQVIIPFEALRVAGIDPSTIRLIEDTGDRHEVKQHTVTTVPAGYAWKSVEVTEYTCKTPAMLQVELDKYNVERFESYAHDLERWYRAKGKRGRGEELDYFENSALRDDMPTEPVNLTVDNLEQRETYGLRFYGPRDPSYRSHQFETGGMYDKVVGHRQALMSTRGKYGGHEWQGDVLDNGDGTHLYAWETRRHWLGDSLITADIRWTETERCSHCKGTGFTGGVVPEPIEGEQMWDYRERTRDQHCQVKANRKFGLDECFRGRRQRRRVRTSYYLSGFDAQETRPSYFFCELPQGVAPTSVNEAIECLKPDPVILAEGMGREVLRQGDIFAIPMPSLTKRELTKMGARHERRGRLLNTNHVATDTAYLPDGTTLARGALVHAPEWRSPDHKRVPLTSVWHVVVKNTVPIAA
jgi:hypothetical protein